MISCSDRPIASAVLKKMDRLTWYFHGRYSPFNLFCEKISNIEKQSIATAIRNIGPPKEYSLGIPKKVILSKTRELATRFNLNDLVKSENHFFFLMSDNLAKAGLVFILVNGLFMKDT